MERVKFFMAMTCVALLCTNGFAQTAEIEPNDSFATSQVLASGELVSTGNLGFIPGMPATVLATYSGTIGDDGTNAVSSFSFGTADGLVAGGFYDIAQTSGIDTRHGQFDSAGTGGTLLAENDGFLDFIGGAQANGSGDLFLSVAHWQNGTYDAAFVGTTGDFAGEIRAQDGSADTPESSADFFTFTGLTAGAEYTATTALFGTNSADTVLGLFDGSGALIASNDDGGPGLYSELVFIADGTGTATLAVSGFGDIGAFDGGYTTDGGYSLTLIQSIPEPASLGLISVLGLVAVARRRRA